MLSLRLEDRTAVHGNLLEIKTSTVEGGDVGLFTLRDRTPGSFIGVYGGVFTHESAAGGAYCADFPGGVGEEGVVQPQSADGTIDYDVYPMAAINEPPPGRVANVFVVDDVVYEFEGRSFRLLALHAACPIGNGEELFWHYGGTYERSYDVGAPAVPIVPSPKIDEKTLKELVETRVGTAIFEISDVDGARLRAAMEADTDPDDDDDDDAEGAPSAAAVAASPAEPWSTRLRVRARMA